MRKLYWLAIVAVGAGISAGAATAATLGNLSGQSCGDGLGTWHFVNNQTGGAGPGTLIATFSGTPSSCTTGPSKVLSSTQHFYCSASGALLGASTNLPGKLVLSDFSCEDVKNPPPPPCDPKTEICK